MGFYNFIETFFYISLGITFILILLLIYHFKQRVTTVEHKYDTMVEIMNHVVKELGNIKQYVSMMNMSTPIVSSLYNYTPFQMTPNPIHSENVVEEEEFEQNIHFNIEEKINEDDEEEDEEDQEDDQEDDQEEDQEDDQEEDHEDDQEDDQEEDQEDEHDNDQEDDQDDDQEEDQEDDQEENQDEYHEEYPEYEDNEHENTHIEVQDLEESHIDYSEVEVNVYDEVIQNNDNTDDNDLPQEIIPEEIQDIMEESNVKVIHLEEEKPVEDLESDKIQDMDIENIQIQKLTETIEVEPEPEQTHHQQLENSFKKMNIHQLKALVIAKGIATDVAKLKKNDLIKLLESLDS